MVGCVLIVLDVKCFGKVLLFSFVILRLVIFVLMLMCSFIVRDKSYYIKVEVSIVNRLIMLML